MNNTMLYTRDSFYFNMNYLETGDIDDFGYEAHNGDDKL